MAQSLQEAVFPVAEEITQRLITHQVHYLSSWSLYQTSVGH